jgi:dUTPase
MSQLRYFVDYDRAKKKSEELNIVIVPQEPNIKNGGLFGDVGIDLFAAYDCIVYPHTMWVVDTFVGFLYEVGTFGLLWPRGGDTFLIGSGVMDTGYTGTTKVKIINPYENLMLFSIGDSVGQLVITRRAYEETPSLFKIEHDSIDRITERGKDGRITNQFSL